MLWREAASGKQIAEGNLRPYPIGIRLSEGATVSKLPLAICDRVSQWEAATISGVFAPATATISLIPLIPTEP